MQLPPNGVMLTGHHAGSMQSVNQDPHVFVSTGISVLTVCSMAFFLTI